MEDSRLDLVTLSRSSVDLAAGQYCSSKCKRSNYMSVLVYVEKFSAVVNTFGETGIQDEDDFCLVQNSIFL